LVPGFVLHRSELANRRSRLVHSWRNASPAMVSASRVCSSIKHYIDLSRNEVWTGTTQLRSVKRDGERLVYTTPPFHFHTDGKKSINTLVWEKVK
jgi:hypothetical protein